MQTQKTHWPSILILIVMVSGAGLFFITALAWGFGSIFSLAGNRADAAGRMISSITAAVEGLLTIGGAWFVLQKTRGLEQADRAFRMPYAHWQLFAALGIIPFALLIGGLASFSQTPLLGWLLLPALTLLVIVAPIWTLLGLGSKGIEFGSRWRVFGIFGIGLTVGPLIMITLEIALLVLFIIGLVLYLVANPDLALELSRLITLLENETDPVVILELLAPYILLPGVAASALSFIALAVPMIEEIFKPLGIWLFARSIESPAQGFALGLLSGAAYALVEGFGVSGSGGSDWAVTVGMRAATSLLHITTTGLMGWAIVAAFQEKRILRLLGTYASAVLIHGLWNAAALSIVYSTIANYFGNANRMTAVFFIASCGLFIVGIGLLVLLLSLNRKAKLSIQNTQAGQSAAPSAAGDSQTSEGVK